MKRVDPFVFADTPIEIQGECVVRVPRGMQRTEDLFQVLYERAYLPGYFGFNWSALSDCLRDLGWSKQRVLTIVHEDVPQLPLVERRTYLDVLAECIKSWGPDGGHALRVVFPTGSRTEVEELLNDDQQ